MRKAIISAIFVAGICSSAFAGKGPIFMCHSDDYRVVARAMPQIGEVEVEKTAPGMPSYLFTGCQFGGDSYRMLFCTEAGGRVFIMNRDMTAKYIGSGRTADLSCVLSTSHGE